MLSREVEETLIGAVTVDPNNEVRSKENKERGSCGNGRLLIHLYYSAVTGNRKQVLTGSSESCEHKCR